MKKLILALIMAMAPSIAFAQSSQRNPCYYNLNGGCTNVPTSGSIDDPVTNTLTATGQSITIPTNGRSTVGISISGTWSGALQTKGSVDYSIVGAANANFGVTTAVSLTNGTISAALTSNGIYQMNASGLSAIQIYATNIASGSVTISMLSSVGVSTVMADNPIPVTGSFSLSGFHQESVLTPFTATTLGVASGLFTAGKVIIVTNAGTTNTAYCQLGTSATTSSQPVAPNGGWIAFTSTSETQVACATSTSTTTINVSVGTGLPTGTGGGSGSGGASSSFGSAFPATGTAVGFTDGTNMVAGKVRNPGTGAVTSDPAVVVADPQVLAAVNNPATLGSASGGLSTNFQSALSTTVAAVDASAGQLYELYCYNPNASVAYVQLFDAATGSVTLGTTTPKLSYGIPATNASGFTVSLVGTQFSTAISAAATTTATGNTALGTALVCNFKYK